jgi:cellulose synthase (UDP-forming)
MKLIHATDSVTMKRVLQWWDYPIFLILIGVIISAMIYAMQYWFSLGDWRKFPTIYLISTLILIVELTNYLGRWFILLIMRKPVPIPAKSSWKACVVTTFVPGSESLEMLEATVRAIVAMDYPHDTWVLDEGNDLRVRELCERLDASYFSRKNLPQYQTKRGTFQAGSKHGNYNAWLHEIGFEHYDIISAFDPDHVPQPNFLSRVIGYFNDPKIGYVQTAPAYYNQSVSFIAHGAAEETYAYHSSVQMAAFALGYPIIIGSHHTHRVKALREVGGFAPHEADDILVTLYYRERGWQGVYVPEILARGLTPVDWNGYLIQQRRWARSVMDLKFRFYLKMAKNLPLRSRIAGFVHGLNYLYKSLSIFAAYLLLLFVLATGVSPKMLSRETMAMFLVLFGVLIICDFYRQRFYLDRDNEWGLHWRVAILQFAKWPYFIMALVDVIAGRNLKFATTPKANSTPKIAAALWPQLAVFMFICTAWAYGYVSGNILNPLIHIVASTVLIGIGALMLTAFVRFPDPFECSLLSKQVKRFNQSQRRTLK